MSLSAKNTIREHQLNLLGEGDVLETKPRLRKKTNENADDRYNPENYWVTSDRKSIKRTVTCRKPRRKHTTVVASCDVDDLPLELGDFTEQRLLRQARRPKHAAPHGPVRVVDMFAGCGGMSLGVRDACEALGHSFVAAAALDTNIDALKVYAANFGGREPEPVDLGVVLASEPFSDLTKAEAELVRRIGRVDVVVAGPPCQGHSSLNNVTRRDDPRNQLYLRVARVGRLLRPRWIIVENVVTVTSDRGGVVNQTKQALRTMGYSVSEGIINCGRIGVPQRRRRHILLAGVTEELREPLPTIPEIVRAYTRRTRSLRWAIGDLVEREADYSFMDRATLLADVTKARIDYLFDNDCYDLPDHERPACHRLKEHTYGSVYGRMRWDDSAPTITSGFATMGRGRFVHPSKRRTLTPREAARIQGFPDYFDFSPMADRRSALIEVIGNAVPPRLAYAIALECLR